MTDVFGMALFWFALAVIFALVEIESEGKYGWAEKMPTWYRTQGLVARVYGLFLGGKPLTGYHAFMFFLPLVVFHSPFVMGVDWSLEQELLTVALYLAWCPLWDFLWFVLNPHYTIWNFRPQTVWWHAKSCWVFGWFPIDYLTGWLLSITVVAIVSYFFDKTSDTLVRHGLLLGSFLTLTLITIIVAPFYHSWYKRMRERDDRDDAKIFHD